VPSLPLWLIEQRFKSLRGTTGYTPPNQQDSIAQKVPPNRRLIRHGSSDGISTTHHPVISSN